VVPTWTSLRLVAPQRVQFHSAVMAGFMGISASIGRLLLARARELALWV
jgi:hypothetical protein